MATIKEFYVILFFFNMATIKEFYIIFLFLSMMFNLLYVYKNVAIIGCSCLCGDAVIF